MPKHHHRLEAPTLDEQPATPAAPEVGPLAESEPRRESVDTVRQLMDAWRDEYEQTDDGKRKSELAYRMVRMDMACQAANLSPDEVKIREAESGVLGFYVPSTGEIAITTGGLALDAEHYQDVLKHESTHAGKMNVHRISDEGLTQHNVERGGGATLHDIYPQEMKKAEETFEKIGIPKALELYNFDKPGELIDYWLSVEWNDEWKNKWQAELGDQDVADESVRQELIEGAMKEWLGKLEENFEAAAPRLLANAEQQGFDFAETHEREFARVVKEFEEKQ